MTDTETDETESTPLGQTKSVWRELARKTGCAVLVTVAAGVAVHLGTVLDPRLAGATATGHVTRSSAEAPRIQEDDPRWDCRTMGNLVCGPGNSTGAPAGDYGNNPERFLTSAEVDVAIDAQWLCFDQLGHNGDAIVPSAEDLALCRRAGLAAAVSSR